MTKHKRSWSRGLWADPPSWVLMLSLVGAAIALACCAFGSPWSISWHAAAVVTGLSAVPIALLSILAVRCRNEALYRLRSSREEWESFDSRLTHNAGHWRSLLRESREAAQLAAAGGVKQLPVVGLPDGLSRDAMVWVQYRFAAGEGLQTDVLRSYLENSALMRLDKLNKFLELAFTLGVLGAIMGLGAQILVIQRLTEGGFLASGFMAGVVLKAAVSVVGANVALYARSLRWKQMERYDKLVGRLEEFVSTQIGTLFRDAGMEDGDLGLALHDAAGRIERMGKSLEERLPTLIEDVVTAAGAGVEAALSNAAAGVEAAMSTAATSVVSAAGGLEARLPIAVSDAVTRGLSGIRGVIAEELGAALRENVTQPFRVEMISMTESVKGCSQAIQEASGKFRDSMNSLEREVRAAIGEREAALRAATDTISVLATVPEALEKVVREIHMSVAGMKAYRGELENAIQSSRGHNSGTPANGDSLHEHIQLANILLEALRAQYEAPSRQKNGPAGRN